MADRRPVRAALFDLDDTLFDHTRSTRSVLAGLRERYECFRRLDFETLAATHTRLLDELHVEVLAGQIGIDEARVERIGRLFAAAGEKPPRDMLVRAARDYRDAYVASWNPVPGAVELLAALHGQVLTGIVTNNLVAEQTQKLQRCGFEPYLNTTVISEEAGFTKPDPRMFRVALDRLHVEAASTVMVGDAWAADIVGALGAGLRVVWLNRFRLERPDSTRPVTEIQALEPTAEVASLILQRDTAG